MKSTRLVIFENSTANFRLSVDTMLSKPRPDGSESDLVFLGKDSRTGTFRPSVFLVFTYLTDDYTTTQGVYTSYAHMYRIRSMFSAMHDVLNSSDAFVTVNGELTPNSKYSQPLVIDHIGKNNDWISLTLSRFKDQNSVQYFPAVALEISKSNGYSSLLSASEFESIYDVIMHLDLVNMENQAVILELVSRLGVGGTSPAPTAQSQQSSPAQSGYRGGGYGGGYHGNDHRNGYYQHTQSQYGAAKQSYQTPYSAPSQTAPAVTAGSVNGATKISQDSRPQVVVDSQKPETVRAKEETPSADPTITESQIPTNSPSKPKVSMDAVSKVQISDIDMDINDSSIIDGIFADAGKSEEAGTDSGKN